jgi:hypothetical protein
LIKTNTGTAKITFRVIYWYVARSKVPASKAKKPKANKPKINNRARGPAIAVINLRGKDIRRFSSSLLEINSLGIAHSKFPYFFK